MGEIFRDEGRADKAMNNSSNSSLKKKRIESVLKSLASGTSFLKACKAADIDQSTFWLWRQADKKLDKRVLEVLDSRTQTVEDALYSNALKGNVIAEIFWLKNRASDRWKDKTEQSLEGGLDITIKYANEKKSRSSIKS